MGLWLLLKALETCPLKLAAWLCGPLAHQSCVSWKGRAAPI